MSYRVGCLSVCTADSSGNVSWSGSKLRSYSKHSQWMLVDVESVQNAARIRIRAVRFVLSGVVTGRLDFSLRVNEEQYPGR